MCGTGGKDGRVGLLRGGVLRTSNERRQDELRD